MLRPFGRYVQHLLVQSRVSLVVELHQVGMTAQEVLGHQAQHRVFGIEQRTEVEQLQEQLPFVLLPQRRQLGNTLAGRFLLVGNVAVDALVVDDGSRFYGGGQHQSFERTAATQCDVHLAWGKRHVGINHCVVEGLSLTLVDSDSPG